MYEEIIDCVTKLSQDHHNKLFIFFKLKNVHYTKNKNGVFIDISKLDTGMLLEIKKIIDECQHSIELDNRIKEKISNDCLNNDNILDDIEIKTDTLTTFTFKQNDVNVFERDRQKINKKNVHMKFNTAIKKYNKFSSSDIKKIDLNNSDSLNCENYIL